MTVAPCRPRPSPPWPRPRPWPAPPATWPPCRCHPRPSASSSAVSTWPWTPSRPIRARSRCWPRATPGSSASCGPCATRGITPAVVPAVSSVALAFARLGLDWDDALVAVGARAGHRPGRWPPPWPTPRPPSSPAHRGRDRCAPGRSAQRGPGRLRGRASSAPRTSASVTSPPTPPPRSPTRTSSSALAGTPSPAGPRWLAGHPGAPGSWALAEDDFDHRDSMITKSEVRALALAKLGPGPGRTIWDVGRGLGFRGGRMRPLRRLGHRHRGRPGPVRPDPRQRDPARRAAARRSGPRPGSPG